MVQPMIDINYFGANGVPSARFAAEALDRKRSAASARFRTDEPAGIVLPMLAAIGGELRSETSGHGARCIEVGCDDGDWSVLVHADDGRWSVTASAADHAKASQLVDALAILAGPPPTVVDGCVSLAVWTESTMGGGSTRYSKARVGAWSDVADNYPGEVGAQLAGLAEQMPDPSAGGIIVFCGEPGTGKTRAVEALIASWATSADVSLVVDADRLLSSAAYLADVLSHSGDQPHVVVVEDVDDLIAVPQAGKAKRPEAAKLLNVADGLLGRCAGSGGTLWVLTANLPVDGVADYIRRPGRAAAVVPFRKFSIDEATAWAESRGVAAPVDRDMSLAELFAL